MLVLVVVVSGMSVYATTTYLASNVTYNNTNVASALDDLYNKSANYVLPSGTKTITTKENNIDVSKYQYADTTGLYTANEYNAKTGQGTYWNSGSFTSVAGVNSINIGFTPSKLTIIRYDGDVGYAYDSSVSTSIVSKFSYGSNNNTVKVNVLSSGTPTSQQIILGNTTKIYISTANNIWYWFATK